MQTVQVPFTAKVSHSRRWIGSPAVAISGNDMEARREIVLTNNAGMTVYIGSAGVTMNDGTPIGVGKQISIPMAGSIALYGVGSGTGSTDVRMLEFG